MQLRDAGRLALAARSAKVAALGARRLARWLLEPSFAAPERATPTGRIAHRVRIPIARAGADPRLEAGKRTNVKLAATAFHGVVFAPDRPLSFWRTLGPATAARGFAWGMELKSGCAVPAIGGGICLVSNALFTIAAELGWEILERHGHSLALSDPHAFDATVAFPHIDLRIAPRDGRAVLGAAVRGDVLVIEIYSDAPALRVDFERVQREDGDVRETKVRRKVWRELALIEDAVIVDDRQRIPHELKTCLDCGETACTARVELPSERTMIALIGPANQLLDACREVGETEVWSPISVPSAVARVPGAIGRFASRRNGLADVRGPLLLADAALRAWAGDRTDRKYVGELALRVATDAWAAREVTRRRPRTVIASSLAARSTFAAARAIGATCVLVIDVPLLRALHRDLDRAAEMWPTRQFLRNYRAPSWAIARQEAERALADLILVRGRYAKSLCLADGVPANRVALLPAAPGPTIAAPSKRLGRVRLAGLAAARHGIDTALAATAKLGVTLVVRSGEGTEPADLAARAGVAAVAHDRDPVDAIICPAVCETYAPELRATGIPVIASPMASRDGRGPDPFDADALAQAIVQAVPQGVECLPSIAPLLAALR